MLRFIGILALLPFFITIVLANEFQYINKEPEHARFVSYLIKFENDYQESCKVCWEPGVWDKAAHGDYDIVCGTISPGESSYFFTSVGDRWHATTLESNLETVIPIIGGKHNYEIKFYFGSFPVVESPQLVHVRTPGECPDYSGYQTLGITWRDGARIAAHRHAMALCMCGEFNQSSSFTVDVPNTELPLILDGNKCNCDGEDQAAYDLWIPCNFVIDDIVPLLEKTDCSKQTDETRLLLLHTTTSVDRLSLKNKMWESFRFIYGVERASFLMPRAYWLQHNDEDLEEFRHLCREIVKGGHGRERVFIMKDVYQHQQKGISLSSAQQLINKGLMQGSGLTDGFAMATEFLARPFMVKGYKLNLRRYMVAVCTGGRLRGYVHDDGKIIYTKKKYREPWVGEEWENNQWAFARRLEELITTGYVDESHYDDKPLSGLEFFEYVREDLNLDPSYLQASMFERLALALQMSIRDGDYNLCDTHPSKTEIREAPSCLDNAVRFQHFGCDFHVDAALTGYESRLFECNKGPDFSVHSYRDGNLKREVAADVLSFIGFKGPFDGSAEHARKFKMNLIYDSETYDPNKGFEFLESLEHVDPSLHKPVAPLADEL